MRSMRAHTAISPPCCAKTMESLVFPLQKSFLGGRKLTFAPTFCILEVQNGTLNYSRGSLSAFCLEPGCSPDCSRASISGIKPSKLAPCVVHCGHTVASAASYEVNEGTHSDSTLHVVQKQWNHQFSPSENSHFLVVTSSLSHPNSGSLRARIAY